MKKLIALALLASVGSAYAQDACSVTVKGNDAMQFDIAEIKINKAACADGFTVNLEHAGTLPAAAMGHNVVISKTADVDGVAADGAANPGTDYVKPDDERVVAYTKMIGGGEKADVKVDVSKLEAGGDYSFFCSFPGHYAIMRGKVVVE